MQTESHPDRQSLTDQMKYISHHIEVVNTTAAQIGYLKTLDREKNIRGFQLTLPPEDPLRNWHRYTTKTNILNIPIEWRINYPETQIRITELDVDAAEIFYNTEPFDIQTITPDFLIQSTRPLKCTVLRSKNDRITLEESFGNDFCRFEGQEIPVFQKVPETQLKNQLYAYANLISDIHNHIRLQIPRGHIS